MAAAQMRRSYIIEPKLNLDTAKLPSLFPMREAHELTHSASMFFVSFETPAKRIILKILSVLKSFDDLGSMMALFSISAQAQDSNIAMMVTNIEVDQADATNDGQISLVPELPYDVNVTVRAVDLGKGGIAREIYGRGAVDLLFGQTSLSKEISIVHLLRLTLTRDPSRPPMILISHCRLRRVSKSPRPRLAITKSKFSRVQMKSQKRFSLIPFVKIGR